jgi:hypothetical protein
MVPYQQALIQLSRRFIRIFALALDLPEDYFDKIVTYPMAGVRSLHYPPMTASEDEETGLGAHTDIECMSNPFHAWDDMINTPESSFSFIVFFSFGQIILTKEYVRADTYLQSLQ